MTLDDLQEGLRRAVLLTLLLIPSLLLAGIIIFILWREDMRDQEMYGDWDRPF